jgi:glycosyltransferase involved in cell wall biosynthesis
MKVSIITATYNSAESIKSSVNSVLNQNYNDIEHLIIDGKSSDNTLLIIKDLVNNSDEVQLFIEEDKGIYDALNKGVNLSNGDVIGFVHSDDLLASPLIVSEIVEKIIKENLDGVYGNLNYVQKLNVNKIVRKWQSNNFDYDLLKKGWMPAHPTFFLKKSVYEKHGLFNLNYSISADYDFMMRVLSDKSLKFGYLPKVITKMRVGGESNRSLKNIILKTKEDYLIIKRNNIGNFLTLIMKNTSKFTQLF